MSREQGRKAEALSRLFAEVRRRCGSGPLVFDNQLAKEVTGAIFSNQYDVTKIDTSAKLPEELREAGYFVIHLGGGRHQFVQGIDAGYHQLEPIPPEDIIDWKYRKSLLNEADTSEAKTFNFANNQKVLHDFLYEDTIAVPKLFSPRHIRASFDYIVDGQVIEIRDVRTKIAPTVEHLGEVAICYSKMGRPHDFGVCRLYHAFRWFCLLRDKQGYPIRSVSVVFMNCLRNQKCTVLELRSYHFSHQALLGSISLSKAARYNLLRP